MIRVGYFLGSGDITKGGVAPYAWRLLKLLLESSDLHMIKLCIVCEHLTLNSVKHLIDITNSNASIITLPSWMIRSSFKARILNFPSRVAKTFKATEGLSDLLNLRRAWFRALPIDVLHVPYQTSPIYLTPYPIIITMHDVQDLHFPHFFTPDQRAWRSVAYWEALRESEAVIVSYNHVKDDLLKFFPLNEAKINVCRLPYHAIDLQKPSDAESRVYHKKHGDLSRAVLYPATTWAHKNHISLMKAVELASKQGGRRIRLVCTGRTNQFYETEIKPQLLKSPVLDDNAFLGLVPEQELSWLYSNCALVVIPTLYEAGSFPLLEAMSQNVPVICSNVTSLPTEIGNSKFLFSPLHVPQMAELILENLDNPKLVKENKENSERQFAALMNQNPAIDYAALYCTIVSR